MRSKYEMNMMINHLETEKLKRNAERKIMDRLEKRQMEIASVKHTISSAVRQLEDMIGREGAKDFLNDYPLAF